MFEQAADNRSPLCRGIPVAPWIEYFELGNAYQDARMDRPVIGANFPCFQTFHYFFCFTATVHGEVFHATALGGDSRQCNPCRSVRSTLTKRSLDPPSRLTASTAHSLRKLVSLVEHLQAQLEQPEDVDDENEQLGKRLAEGLRKFPEFRRTIAYHLLEAQVFLSFSFLCTVVIVLLFMLCFLAVAD